MVFIIRHSEAAGAEFGLVPRGLRFRALTIMGIRGLNHFVLFDNPPLLADFKHIGLTDEFKVLISSQPKELRLSLSISK